MVREKTINGLSVADAMKMRCDAERLLNRLLAEREVSEERCIENGKRDPIKQVTGASAMDVAIREARKMIEQLDAILSDGTEKQKKQPEERPVVATIARRLLATPSRAAVRVAQ